MVNNKPVEAKVKKTGIEYWTGKETKKLYAMKLEDDSWCYADLAEPVTEQEVAKFLTWMLKPDLKHFRHAAAMFKASGTLLRWQERIIGTSPEPPGAKITTPPTLDTPKVEKEAVAKPQAEAKRPRGRPVGYSPKKKEVPPPPKEVPPPPPPKKEVPPPKVVSTPFVRKPGLNLF